MNTTFESLPDLDSLPTSDHNVSSTPTCVNSTATTSVQQHQVVPLGASVLVDSLEISEIDNFSITDLENEFGAIDRTIKTDQTLSKMLFDGLKTPPPGLVNLAMKINGLQQPVPEGTNDVLNLHTFPVVPTFQSSLSPSPQPTVRESMDGSCEQRDHQQHLRLEHLSTPSPPPPPRLSAGKIKMETPYFKKKGIRPIVGSKKVPRAVPRKSKSKPSNPLEKAVLRFFPVELLRSDRDTYKAALREHQSKLSRLELQRLRELRRKELSCVYADNARHRRIGRMEELEEKVRNLEAENEALRKQLAKFKSC